MIASEVSIQENMVNGSTLEEDCLFDQPATIRRSNNNSKADLPYLVVTGILLPFYLLLEWTTEWYVKVDFYETWKEGPKIAALSGIFGMVLSHSFLTPTFHRRMRGSTWKALVPAIAITLSNILVFLGRNYEPTCVMVASMLYMAKTIHCSRRVVAGYEYGELDDPLMLNQEELEAET